MLASRRDVSSLAHNGLSGAQWRENDRRREVFMLKRIGASFAAQSLSLVLSFADRFVLVGILLRAWGPEIYADWTILLASAGLLGLGECGLGIYFGNVWQRTHALGDAISFRRLVQVSIFCYGLLCCILGTIVLGLVLASDLRHLLSIGSLSRHDTLVVFLVLAAVSISTILRGSISQIYRGRGEFARGILVSSLPLAASLSCATIAGMLSVMPVGLAVIYLMCDLLAGSAIIVRDISRRHPDLRLKPAQPTGTELADLVTHAKWYAVQQGAPIAWLQMPVLVLGSIGVTGSTLVSFVILRTLVNTARQLVMMLALSAGVELAPGAHRGDREHLAGHLSAVATLLAALVGALIAGIVLLGENFVGMWTGKRDLFDSWTLIWLVTAAIIATPATPLGVLFMLGNWPKPAALANLVQLGIGIVAGAALASRFGAAGAAAGLALGEAAASGVLLPIVAQRYLGIDYPRYIAGCIKSFLASTIVSGLACGLAVALIGSSTPITFVACAALWAFFGLAPAIYMSLPDRQRNRLNRALVTATSRHPGNGPRP
jgi:O-antigen/teichoic acid export membrane protein